ncbi:uncharacterized protein Z520_03782 [Fonsecaea multimorphosa CBS 102226]|uniref:Uncharacterized protein n=1 Tax=Fonsecaea multimorphosa CBS 102226 TaxID=1442371 RepID=A0A0D2IT12_9EURO|nr:uncharacterized protein Z520_03782 [Fonsecaea multimorphosa CBS 102226]KIY00097.1 hypothetical protein Z520_03782 [Fonsecaea multimorphosa CBS 102226]OAL27294.1 hypothetical protein AYO22_03569 [Fonsecaea multimorphosa]
MPDEDWRDEIQEYALLLDAVASGDRSRVVKHLTEYILNKKEGNQVAQPNDQGAQGAQEPYSEHDENSFNYYGEDAYNDPYTGTSTEPVDQEGTYTGEEKDLEYGDEQYQYGNEYDEYDPPEYDASGAGESYYEGPYMSGAYHEPDNGVDTYDEGPYDDYTELDPSAHGNESYAIGAAGIRDMTYTGEHYDDSNRNNYEGPQYPEDQQYEGQYYDQQADGIYDDWNQDGETYHYQQGTGVAGGEWHEESDYGPFSDDQIQEVVDEVPFDELHEEYFEEGQTRPYADPMHSEEEVRLSEEHFDEDQVHPHDDHVHSEEEARLNEDDVLPGYDEEQTQLQQPYPEDTSHFYNAGKDAPPDYSEVLHYAMNQNPQTQYVPYRPDLTGTEEQAGADENGWQVENAANRHAHSFDPGTSADPVEFEDDEWEDEACEGEDDTIRSPNRSDLQFNPLRHQYERDMSGQRPNALLYLSPVEPSLSNVLWGRNWR